MGIPVLIIGKSGAGKSASMRNMTPANVGVINVMGKPLPFRNEFKPYVTTDYMAVRNAIERAKVNSIVIDDAGYLITARFMKDHAAGGHGNAIFSLYNDLADDFYNLIRFIAEGTPPYKIVYLFMHEEKNDFGDIKPKTIGKMLDEKVCLEGLFTIALRAVGTADKHIFATQSNGFDVAKSPIGMFDSLEIDNDLAAVDAAIRDYWNLKEEKSE